MGAAHRPLYAWRPGDQGWVGGGGESARGQAQRGRGSAATRPATRAHWPLGVWVVLMSAQLMPNKWQSGVGMTHR